MDVVMGKSDAKLMAATPGWVRQGQWVLVLAGESQSE